MAIPSTRKAIRTGASRFRRAGWANLGAITGAQHIKLPRYTKCCLIARHKINALRSIPCLLDVTVATHGVFIEEHGDQRGSRNGYKSADDAGKRGAQQQGD